MSAHLPRPGNYLALFAGFLALVFVACGGDDDEAATPTAMAPEPTQEQAAVTQWPEANRDIRNTRATFDSGINAGNVEELGVAWSFDIPAQAAFGAAATNPVVVDDVVYLHDLESDVHAVNLETGETMWSTDYNNETVGPNGVAVEDGRVFALSSPTTLVGLDARSGEEIWSTTFENAANMQPLAHDGMVYFGTTAGANESYDGGTSGMAYGINSENGEVQWEFQVVEEGFWGNPEINSGGGIWYPPAIDEERGLVYWGTGNPAPFPGIVDYPNGESRPGPNLYTNSVVALSQESGEMQWYNQVLEHDIFDLDLQLSPILANVEGVGEMIIATGKIGRVYGIDPETHEIIWQQSVGTHQNDELDEIPIDEATEVYPGTLGGVETPFAYADNTVYLPVLNLPTEHTATSWGAQDGPEALANATEHTASAADGTGNLVAIDATNGDVRWSHDFDESNFGAATVVNDLVFTSTFDGVVHAFDRESGEVVWDYQAPAGINGWPAVAGDTILVPAGLGESPQLVALRLGATGETGMETPQADGTPEATPSPTATAAADGGEQVTREVSATDIAFDVDTITVPAGARVSMPFINNDELLHNVAIYESADAEQDIFVGELFTGPDEAVTYEFQAPSEPGEYFFRCDVHPLRMTGTFIVE